MSGPQEYESDEQRKVRITNETEQAAQGFLRSPADWKTQLKTQYPDKDFNGKDKGEYEKLLLAEETKLAALLFEPMLLLLISSPIYKPWRVTLIIAMRKKNEYLLKPHVFVHPIF